MSKYKDIAKRISNLSTQPEYVEYVIEFGPAMPAWEPGMDRAQWLIAFRDYEARYDAWAKRHGIIHIKFEPLPEDIEE